MRAQNVARIALVGLFVVLVSGVLAPRAGAVGEYTVTDIGTFVGTGDGQFDSLVNSIGTAVNADGVVVAAGYESGDDPWMIGFTSADGKVKRVGKEKANSNLLDINDAGVIVGWTTSRDDTGFVETVGTIWRDGETYDMLALGRDISQVRAINERGVAVGDASPADFTLTIGDTDVTQSIPRQAILWGDDGVVDLGTLGGDYSTAIDINESNQVVGRSNLVTGESIFYPYVWNDGSIQLLETPEGTSGVAYKINDDGVIAGSIVLEDASPRASRWVDGGIELLPDLLEGGISRATGIDSAGDIVGWSSQSVDSPDLFATLWQGDAVVDLNTLIPADSGYILRSATDINDAGQITVSANREGEEFVHGIVLSPVDESAAQIGIASARLPTAALSPREA